MEGFRDWRALTGVRPSGWSECELRQIAVGLVLVASGELAVGEDVAGHGVKELLFRRCCLEVQSGVEGVEIEDVAVG